MNDSQADSPQTLADLVAGLKRRRKLLRLTQADLAGLAGMTTEGLSKIERGDANPRLDTVFKLVQLLGGTLEVRWKA